MFQKSDDSIGLEIGDGLVKAMHMRCSAKENKLLGYEIVSVNFREGRQGIVNAMNDVLTRLSLNKKKHKVNISVSGESVMVRDIHWPQMDDDDIRKALKFEVERQVHYKTDEIVFDYYSVLDKTIAETKTRVILVAAKKDLIENYISLIDSTGFQPGFIEVDTFSLLNCFYVNGPKVPAEKTIAIINIGMEVTNIDIIRGKIVGLTKDAFVAWSNLIDALPEDVELDFADVTALKGVMGSDDIYELSLFILNALSNQIRRTIEFYESQGRDTVEEIYLSGKVAMYKNLGKYLQNILGLQVTIWNPLANVQYDPKQFEGKKLKEQSLMLAVCTGLACYRAFNINLASAKKEVKKNKLMLFVNKNKTLFYIASIVIICLIGLWVILVSQLKMKEANKQKLLEQNQKLEGILRDIDNLKQGRVTLQQHMQIAKALLSRRIIWSKKFHQISTSLPEEMWLTDLYIKEESSSKYKSQFEAITDIGTFNSLDIKNKDRIQILIIKGTAFSKASDNMLKIINDFINALKYNQEFSRDFSTIELKRSQRVDIGDRAIMKFSMECVLK
ncbi:MAG: type IV pilus assembly protein PilM [Candidatus Omnitrophica bacterium]|nr:type IV pilus assembly protein PilM [Candidatus Omnitrophota bacterium]